MEWRSRVGSHAREGEGWGGGGDQVICDNDSQLPLSLTVYWHRSDCAPEITSTHAVGSLEGVLESEDRYSKK